MILNFSRVHPDVILPTRANPSDAGLDLYYCPLDNDGVMLKPGQTALFGTGIRIEIPHGYYFEIKNRSGNAYKRQLLVGACVVDSGYSGEIFVNLHNIGKTKKLVEEGDKIAQLVLVPVVQWRACEVHEGELYNDPLTISNRGSGALGSTGE